ncbi:DUF771 domain-containing protein [Listeria monocytogenes]|nr:DUF771 domain-containing protein [Listeria monocytogenes]
MSLFQIDEELARQTYKEVVRELLEEEGEIGSIWRMERMRQEVGGFSRQWVVEHVCHHPYVERNQLAINIGTEWIFKASGIKQFLDMYFPDLAKKWKKVGD